MKLSLLSLLLILLLFSANSVAAQRSTIFQIQFEQSQIDSLLKLLDKTKDLREKVLIYKKLCWNLRTTNAEEKAIYYADKGIELARKINFKKGEADITRYKGIITWNFFHQNMSIDLYKEALRLSKEIGDKEGEAYSYDRLGMTAFYNDKNDEALHYFNKAISIFNEINNNEGLAYVYSHFNWVYTKKAQYNLALQAGRQALEIRIFLKNNEGISNSYADLGLTYRKINFDSSLIYVTKAVEVAKNNGLELPFAEHSSLLSELYLQVKDYDKALVYANDSYSIADKNNSIRQMEKTAKVIAFVYEQKHDYAKALRFLHIYNNTKDSLFNEEINKKIVQQELQYDYEKEKESVAERERLREVILTAVIIVLIILAVIIFLKYRFTQVLKVEKIRRKISSDLHDDIGATLSSINIYSELAKNEKDNVVYINTIQQHAQKTIGNLDELVWSINPNNDNLKVLINRMRSFALPLLKDNKIKTEFTAELQDEEILIGLEKRRNIYFAFKEMVANVLKHANSSCCSIKINQKKAFLTIEVKDDGKGFEMEMINQQRNGLRNLKRRATENRGDFTIVSTPGKGTTCTFIVQLK